MTSVPCVNTIELNKYLDECDAAEERGEYEAKVAEGISTYLIRTLKGRESLAEHMIEEDESRPEVRLVIACIEENSKPESFNADDIFSDELLMDIVQGGTESCYTDIEYIIERYDLLPGACKAIIDECVEALSMIQAVEQVEKEIATGPDCDGPEPELEDDRDYF